MLHLALSPEEMIDPCSVESFGCDSRQTLSIVANLTAYTILSEIASGSTSWNPRHQRNRDDIVSDGSSTNSERCSIISREVKEQAAWFVEGPYAAVGGPVWRFAREVDLILQRCERGLPQGKRLALFPPADTNRAHRAEGPKPDSGCQREVAAAEASAFRSCVLEVITSYLRTSDFEGDVGNDEDPEVAEYLDASFAAPWYRRAAPKMKPQALETLFCQRLALLHADMVQNSASAAEFYEEVMGFWLHMFITVGKISKAGCKDVDLQMSNAFDSNGNFHAHILRMLPHVKRHFRHCSEPSCNCSCKIGLPRPF
jgi:hypothetical protein